MITKVNEKKKKTPYSLKSVVSSLGDNNLLGLTYEFPGPTRKPRNHNSETSSSTFCVPKPGRASQRA